MAITSSSIIEQVHKGLYHDVDTRCNLCKPPPNLDPSYHARIKQQAHSVACLVNKNKLLETDSNGSVQYSIQSPPVLPLSCQIEADFKKHCETTATPYEETKPKFFEGNFKDELCLADGTAFLIGKQLVLTAAHCICNFKTDVVSRTKLTSLLVIFGFQTQFSGEVQRTFQKKDVYHIDSVWSHVYKENVVDWAIVKLDREVEDRDLLTFGDSASIHFNTQLYMLGHPLGLPLKLTIGATVKERQKPKKTDEIKEEDEPPLFDADLDAFKGNSGSPVFEIEKGMIIGMLFAGNAQLTHDEKAIYYDQISRQVINKLGYEKCLKITSINFIKTVLASSFKMGYTHFAGRISHLADLKAHLTSRSTSTKVHILYGPGGVGKSELAATFAYKNIEDFSFIWLISCGTEEEQSVGYQGLAKRLQISLEKKETLHSLIQKVHHELEKNESKPWLLLFDNLQKSPDLPTLPLPNKGGSIVITSYKSPKICSLPAEAILATEVLPLEFKEALEFLENVTEKSSEDCKTLLTHVGCYPLILGQVASYIKQTKIEVKGYLGDLKKHEALLATQGDQSKTSGMTLEAAFNMTLQQLPPPAKKWLFICSQLNAALIPASYLKAWLHTEGIPEEQPAIIATLEEHVLLRYNRQEDDFSLHLEFQRILRTIAPVETTIQAAHLLANMKNGWDFENSNNWEKTMKTATIWASHAKSVVKVAGWQSSFRTSHDNPVVEVETGVPQVCVERAHLLDGLGKWEYTNANYLFAIQDYKVALSIYSDIAKSKKDVRNVTSCYNNIGNCLFAQEKYKDALKLYTSGYEILRGFLNENHLDRVLSLNNIGNCYRLLGNYTEALEAYSEVYKILFENNDFRLPLNTLSHLAAVSLNNIANCSHFQGSYDAALVGYNAALKMGRSDLGENHPVIAESLTGIGNCYASQGNYNEALRMHEEGLKIQRIAFGEKHPSVAANLTGIGNCYTSQGNYNEALKVYEDALKIYKDTLGENHLSVAASLTDIGNCYASQKNYQEALKLHKKALKIRKSNLFEFLPQATSLNKIGACYKAQGNYSKALKVYVEAIRIQRRSLGENHPEVAKGLNTLGELLLEATSSTAIDASYKAQVNYKLALEEYVETIGIQRRFLGENHPEVAKGLNILGRCYFSKGNYNEALKAYGEVLEIKRAALGENHPVVGTILNDIGNCYYSQENYNKALEVHGEALRIRKATLGENHPDVASSLNNIARCYYSQGNHNEALKNYREAHSIDMNPYQAKSLTGLGNCYYSQKNYSEALKMHREALMIRKAAFGDNHPKVASSLSNIGHCLNGIGNCYYSQKSYGEALKNYRDALAHRKAAFGDNHPDVARSLNNIGNCYKSQGNYNEALKVHKEALWIKKATLGKNHPEVAKSLNNIGICYDFQGNYSEALEVHDEALRIYRAAALGENHPYIKKSLHNIVGCRARLNRSCAIS